MGSFEVVLDTRRDLYDFVHSLWRRGLGCRVGKEKESSEHPCKERADGIFSRKKRKEK